MKKSISALIALGAFVAPVACTKQAQDPQTTPLVPVTINIESFASGQFPTKGIGEEISATLPTTMDLVMTNKATGETYDVTTGYPCRVPVGTYSVAGVIEPEVRQGIYGTTRYLSDTPKIVVEDELVIRADCTSYWVTAIYKCFVLAVNPSEVESWTGIFKGQAAPVSYMTADGLWWTFVVGDFSADYPFQTDVVFKDGETLSYDFYTRDLQPGGVLAEYGKWYLLRQVGGAIQMGSLSLTLPAWTAGN